MKHRLQKTNLFAFFAGIFFAFLVGSVVFLSRYGREDFECSGRFQSNDFCDTMARVAAAIILDVETSDVEVVEGEYRLVRPTAVPGPGYFALSDAIEGDFLYLDPPRSVPATYLDPKHWVVNYLSDGSSGFVSGFVRITRDLNLLPEDP